LRLIQDSFFLLLCDLQPLKSLLLSCVKDGLLLIRNLLHDPLELSLIADIVECLVVGTLLLLFKGHTSLGVVALLVLGSCLVPLGYLCQGFPEDLGLVLLGLLDNLLFLHLGLVQDLLLLKSSLLKQLVS
jgi:phosphoglycerol transferase MdoB-like AlkP superfamily enzyme